MTDHLDALRDALTAARPVLFGEAMDAADALLAALAPPMEEPTWPGYVMAVCPHAPHDDRDVSLHSLRIGTTWWECSANCSGAGWSDLRYPRPLTDEERAEYGIPSECYKPHAEPITDELVEQCIKATGNFMYPSWVRGVLRGAGHPEAGE